MASFLVAEREQAGWRFLLLWILATTFGFLIGLSAEIALTGRVNLFVAVPMASAGQAYVINRHISIYLPWAVGTSLLWVLGLAVSMRVISIMMTPDSFWVGVAYLATVSFFAGILSAIPQWIFMRDWLDQMGIWWLLINAVESALFFLPGILSGFVLMVLITADKVDMVDRHYLLSGDY